MRREQTLLIERDPRRATAIAAALGALGLAVEVAHGGAEALLHVEAGPLDLIVADLQTLDVDGAELCHLLRLWVRTPIVVIVDSVGPAAVDALDAGADDFVTWPPDPEVLAARLRVALRHGSALAASIGAELLVCGDVELDVAAHLARVGDVSVELQPRQFTLLATLMRNVGRLVTHARLSRVLWGNDSADMDRLRSTISALRKHLGTGPLRPRIESTATLGYRLVPPA